MSNEIEILDDASGVIEFYATEFPKFIRKAAAATGYFVKQEIEIGIKSGAPGGQRYKPLFPEPFRGRLDKAYGKDDDDPNKKPMGKLAQAVRYHVKGSGKKTSIMIGWLDGAEKYGEIQENGLKRPFDELRRKHFFDAGLTPKADKKTMNIPARPTYGPMYRVLRPEIQEYIIEKLDGLLVEDKKAIGGQRKFMKRT